MTIIDLMDQSRLDEMKGNCFGMKECMNSKIGRVNEHLSSKTLNLTIHKGKQPISSPPNQKYIEKIFKNQNKTIMTMSSHPYFRPNSKTEKIVPRIVPRIQNKLVINLSEPQNDSTPVSMKTTRSRNSSQLQIHPRRLSQTI